MIVVKQINLFKILHFKILNGCEFLILIINFFILLEGRFNYFASKLKARTFPFKNN